jgi:hypothetical protein
MVLGSAAQAPRNACEEGAVRGARIGRTLVWTRGACRLRGFWSWLLARMARTAADTGAPWLKTWAGNDNGR